MLSSHDKRQLHDIEWHMHAVDARFARGLAAGAPRLPGEYRRRRIAMGLLLLAVVALAGAGLLLAGGMAGGVPLAGAGLIAGGAGSRGPWRLGDRRR